ncbi:HAMP domain-containing sensor histidine kinase [Spectribacter hydrogenoxidans]|uniref:histidine kinase n=1 Tax=Spectribacter hydrogenoxidans TaxID=3075608 RepID=A0ABU3C102_9GAMM|nr:HAMP domain-containing sensor histidine kinase [Salinisphaera sp. W335]MDT0635242.1 HAMP domain-containing sensor histidine kinase [Salinisphaera sp. W335]
MTDQVVLTPPQVIGLLRRLRWLAAALQAAGTLLASALPDVALPLTPMLAIPVALVGFNVLTGLGANRQAVTQTTVFIHLGADILALTLLLALSGGPANPFVSLYLVPVAIAAAAMPMASAWVVWAVCAAAYSGLFAVYATMPAGHHGGGDFFFLHVAGMWLNFMIAATLTTIALVRLAGLLRQREQDLGEAREKALRDEQIVATGTLAASTAHQLNTPLSTMTLLVDELRNEPALSPNVHADLDTLADQIDQCRQRLRTLLAANADPVPSMRPIRTVLAALLEQWRMAHPDTPIEADFSGLSSQLSIQESPVLQPALANMLDNAARSAPGSPVHIRATVANNQLIVIIEDQGPGLSAADLHRAGRQVFTSHADGHGLGLVLTHSSIEYLGGEVRQSNRQPRGLRTEVCLPLSRLRPA